jgi:acetyl esterase
MEERAQPLYDMLRRIRQPVALRDIMAQCLRHIYTGDPFADEGIKDSRTSKDLPTVSVTETVIAETRCLVYRPTVPAPPVSVAAAYHAADLPSGSVSVAAAYHAADAPNFPLILYFHGGGFVVGCPEDTDYTTRRLCADNNCIVVSVDYPLAPETMFPGALNVCVDVLRALAEQPLENSDPTRIFIAGDSAGGNLAVGVAAECSKLGRPASGLILLAPWLDMNVEAYASFNSLAAEGVVFDAPFIAYARAAYARPHEWLLAEVSPLQLLLEPGPPALIICGGEDPLIDQARKVRAQKGKDARVHVIEYPGMPHCFYSFPGLFEEEKDCYAKISEFLGALGCG